MHFSVDQFPLCQAMEEAQIISIRRCIFTWKT